MKMPDNDAGGVEMVIKALLLGYGNRERTFDRVSCEHVMLPSDSNLGYCEEIFFFIVFVIFLFYYIVWTMEQLL